MLYTVLGMFVGFSVGVFTIGNIVFPLLWAWPRARRMHQHGRLDRPIPAVHFLTAATVALLATTVLILGVRWYAPSAVAGVLAGLALAFLGVMRKFMVPDDAALYVDFYGAYGRYFVTPDEHDWENIDEVLRGDRKPTSWEYLVLLDRCLVSTYIDMPVAFRVSERLPLSLRWRSFTLSVLWVLSIPAALVASIWLRWWVGPVILLAVTPWLFRWGKAALAYDVINSVEHSEDLYDLLVKGDLVRLEFTNPAPSSSSVGA